MADINSKSAAAVIVAPDIEECAPEQAGASQPAAPDGGVDAPANLVKLVELLFFAYRDFTGDADELLTDLGYGRAHHRVIHFVGRHPGLRVADLLDILGITKQSLARVLKQLIDEGFVTQKSGHTDRRERHLYLTSKGLNFAEKLTKLQCARIGNALRTIGPAGEETVGAFLVAMISQRDQASVAELLDKAVTNRKLAQGEDAHGQCD